MGNHHKPPSADVLLQGRPCLVLSPHLDDALLSAFSVVSATPCAVWTVFAGRPHPPQTTSWDVTCGFPNSDATMAARVAEDDNAFAGLPATSTHLGALEGAYAEPQTRQRDLLEVGERVRAWAAQHPEGTIAIPAGAGITVPPPPWERLRNWRTPIRPAPHGTDVVEPSSVGPSVAEPEQHSPKESSTPPGESESKPTSRLTRLRRHVITVVKLPIQKGLHWEHVQRRRRATRDGGLAANLDHTALRELILDLAPSLGAGITVVLYEELPYLWHETADKAVASAVQRHGMKARPVELPVDRYAKLDHLRHYTSQMQVMDPAGRLTQAEPLPGVERFWILEFNPN